MIRVTTIAADSMGCRSMATHVTADSCEILIDPGVGLGSSRYSLSPHPLEMWCAKKLRKRITLFAQSADIVIITHYHSNHFSTSDLDLYRDKIVLLKNPNRDILPDQRRVAFGLIKRIHGVARDVSFVDGRRMIFGNMQITFSDPIHHGDGKDTGFVLQAGFVEDDSSFLFSSDIFGGHEQASLDFILKQDPDLLYLDGPATYLHEGPEKNQTLQTRLKRIQHIIEKTKVVRLILDHHLLRDINWKQKIEPLYPFARQHGVQIQTAAEYRGEENNILEARRKQLYRDEPQKEFI
jgi:predicted metallo-beta-lactamase superfamily hydrolase